MGVIIKEYTLGTVTIHNEIIAGISYRYNENGQLGQNTNENIVSLPKYGLIYMCNERILVDLYLIG